MLAEILLAATLQSFDPKLEAAMRETNVRSLAVAVVKDDQVVYQRTFNATPETRFYLASVPKSFTGLALRILAEEKKLDLDAPLTTTLPRFELPAPLDPSRMSLRDLLTHRLGFENDGLGWRLSYSGEWTQDQFFALLKQHSVVTPRRFSYDNLGYALASYAAEDAAKQPWNDVLRSRVFAPLGMNATSETPCIPTKSPRTMNRGSGGLCSTLPDMVRWLRVNLTDGVLEGKRVFPLAAMREVHAPQISLDRQFGKLHRYAYGLGWYHADYEGDLVMHHFGSYPEAWAHVSYMPDRRIGVVVLSNEFNALPDSVATLAYDTLLGRADAGARFDADVVRLRESLQSMEKQRDDFVKGLAEKATDSDRSLASYAGTYVSDAFGTMVVREEAGTLRATIGDRTSLLTQLRGDTFYGRWFPNRNPASFVFGKDVLTWEGAAFRLIR
jgi:CubicO group peptidase (beta-lactamase class C family)